MHQSLLVGVVHRFRHRRHQVEGLGEGQAGLLQARGEVDAVDVLGDDVARELMLPTS
jgi:hypothetical protein